MENYGYVYKTVNILDNKVYIGQKSGSKFDPNYNGSLFNKTFGGY